MGGGGHEEGCARNCVEWRSIAGDSDTSYELVENMPKI
jgi:hypothetical protein